MSHRRFVIASLGVCLGACANHPPSAQPPPPEPQVAASAADAASFGALRYRGEVAIPGGGLEFFVELVPILEGHAGKLSIPAQGLLDGELGGVVVAEGKLAFALVAVDAHWTAELSPDGTASACKLVQRGMTLECTLEPIDEATFAGASRPPRPQTPQPPFPYAATDVEYDNATDGVHLAGTLTLPPGSSKVAAALLITGSGAQDRDETLVGHKPFLVLADSLTRRGIAVLRVDDRGIGGSTGSLADATGDALARDVAAGIAFLRQHERIEPLKIGMVGHSEGGVIAPRVAAGDAKVAFVVMLAGTGVPGSEVLREQLVAGAKAAGASEADIAASQTQQAAILEIVLDDSTTREVKQARLEALVGPAQAEGVLTPWFLDFVRYDPAPTLAKVKCPVLALNGTLDVQVLPAQNLPAIRKALARNRNATVRELEGLNHLFQPAVSGAVGEYATIEQTIAPRVLELVGDFIVEHTR